MSVTPSHIIEYLFCPRFTWFEYVLGIPQYEERFYKVEKGRNIHELKLVSNRDYLRKKIGAIKKYTDQYLTNDFLRGKVDEVVELKDRSMAPLDYKFARYEGRIYNTYKTQLYCYATLIEDNFNKEVFRGFLVYVRSKNKLIEVKIDQKDKDNVKQVAGEINAIICENFFPKATKFKSRCVTCTYRNICIK
jgi:CRISPR-associated exonuclease Cas4